MTLGGAARRRKGHAWEREVAAMFRDAGYAEAHRGWQSRTGTDDPDIVGVPGFWIECRCRDYISIPASLRKAVADNSKAAASKRGWIAVIGKRTHRLGSKDRLPTRFVAMLASEACEFADAVAKAPGGPPALPIDSVVLTSGGLVYAVFPLDAWFAGIALLRSAGFEPSTAQSAS